MQQPVQHVAPALEIKNDRVLQELHQGAFGIQVGPEKASKVRGSRTYIGRSGRVEGSKDRRMEDDR